MPKESHKLSNSLKNNISTKLTEFCLTRSKLSSNSQTNYETDKPIGK